MTEEQCLVIPGSDCKVVIEQHCTGSDGQPCVKGPPPECTIVINRTCQMVPSEVSVQLLDCFSLLDSNHCIFCHYLFFVTQDH